MSAVEQSPLERRARRMSIAGGDAAACLRFLLGELDAARREIDRLEALTLEHARRRDLGVRS